MFLWMRLCALRFAGCCKRGFQPNWALLGGFLAVLRIGLFSYWINTFYGGSALPAALGGALVLGALPRLKKTARLRYGMLLSVGVAIMALTRPYEGVLLCLPVAVALIHWAWRGENRPRPTRAAQASSASRGFAAGYALLARVLQLPIFRQPNHAAVHRGSRSIRHRALFHLAAAAARTALPLRRHRPLLRTRSWLLPKGPQHPWLSSGHSRQGGGCDRVLRGVCAAAAADHGTARIARPSRSIPGSLRRGFCGEHVGRDIHIPALSVAFSWLRFMRLAFRRCGTCACGS